MHVANTSVSKKLGRQPLRFSKSNHTTMPYKKAQNRVVHDHQHCYNPDHAVQVTTAKMSKNKPVPRTSAAQWSTSPQRNPAPKRKDLRSNQAQCCQAASVSSTSQARRPGARRADMVSTSSTSTTHLMPAQSLGSGTYNRQPRARTHMQSLEHALE